MVRASQRKAATMASHQHQSGQGMYLSPRLSREFQDTPIPSSVKRAGVHIRTQGLRSHATSLLDCSASMSQRPLGAKDHLEYQGDLNQSNPLPSSLHGTQVTRLTPYFFVLKSMYLRPTMHGASCTSLQARAAYSSTRIV